MSTVNVSVARFGLSFILASPVFGRGKRDRALKILFIINGVCSLASAIMTSVNMDWIFSPAGFASLIVWNALVLVIDVFLLGYFRSIKNQDKYSDAVSPKFTSKEEADQIVRNSHSGTSLRWNDLK